MPSSSTNGSDDTIQYPLLLTVDDQTRHWYYQRNRPEHDVLHPRDRGGTRVSVMQNFRNGRTHAAKEGLTLDQCSFELVPCKTKLTNEDFYKISEGDGDLTRKYHAEVESFIKKQVGCDEVIIGNLQVRNIDKVTKSDGLGGVQGYARRSPHTDSSPSSSDAFVLDTLKERGDATKYKRYCHMNLWRNISDHPIEDDHLACLDERSLVKPDDFIPRDFYSNEFDRITNSLGPRHAAQHKWYYYPRMTKSEAILFKHMDSDYTKSGRICVHVSVSDPTSSPENIKPRESIEIRVLCLWKESEIDSMPTAENTYRRLVRCPGEVVEETIAMLAFPLQRASFLQLLRALLAMVPIVGALLCWAMGSYGKIPTPPTAVGGTPYTGEPADYELQFSETIAYFRNWSPDGKKWARKVMSASTSLEEGIRAMTKALVQDSTGNQNTQHFEPHQKAEILQYLLQTERYLVVARKILKPLMTTA